MNQLGELNILRSGFALSMRGGMVRGFGSLGAIKYLEEIDKSPSIIAGSSSGALLGAMYAIGYSVSDIKDIIAKNKVRKHLSFINLITKGGLISRNSFYQLIERTCSIKPGDKDISDLDKTLVIFVCNRADGQRHFIMEGDLVEALYVSCSYPFILEPVKGRYSKYIDGDLSVGYSPKRLRSLGVRKVLGVGYKPQDRSLDSSVIKNPVQRIAELYRMASKEMYDMNMKLDPPDIEILYQAGDASYLDTSGVDVLIERAYSECAKQHNSLIHL